MKHKATGIRFILLAAITALCMGAFAGCGQDSTLDFKKMVNIEFSGLDGNGTISISENDDMYDDRDFLEQLYPDNSKKKAKEKLYELMEDVEYSFSEESDLSNGDEITVTVSYEKKDFEKDEITVKNAEFTVEVSGLSEGTKIDPFDGLSVQYSGISGNGIAFFDTSGCDDFVQDYVTFSCADENLSNGDTITVTAYYDEYYAEEELVVIENDTKEYTVSGLTEPVEIDPFEDLSITYTGASPYIEASIDSTKCDDMVNGFISFEMDTEYLRNGDTFTVTAVYNEYDSEEYGFVVTNDTKEYTVEGQPEYVTSLDGLDLTTLQAEINDKLTVVTTTNEDDWYFAGLYVNNGNFQSISSSSLKSKYLVSLKTNFEDKFDSYYYNYNRYIQIYEYIINTTGGEQQKCYVAVYVNNIQKNKDGTLSWDIELGSDSDENYDTLVNNYATSEKEYYNVTEITGESETEAATEAAESTTAAATEAAT